MYNAYAGNAGFNIRKSQTRHRRDGSICQKYIVCSSQGHEETQTSKDGTRTGSDTLVQFSVSRKVGTWTVQKDVLDHSHCFASPNKLHKLRSKDVL